MKYKVNDELEIQLDLDEMEQTCKLRVVYPEDYDTFKVMTNRVNCIIKKTDERDPHLPYLIEFLDGIYFVSLDGGFMGSPYFSYWIREDQIVGKV